MESIKIQTLKEKDILPASKIASECFNGLKDIKKARKWIVCNFNAYPRMKYFTAKIGKEVVGYILWMEKGGFRKEAVLELEQIAVSLKHQKKGIGEELIKRSFEIIKKSFEKRGSKLKLVEVTTGAGNRAQKLYIKTLKVKPEAVLKDVFNGDEVIMLKRIG